MMTVDPLLVDAIVRAIDPAALESMRWFRHKSLARWPAEPLDWWPVEREGDLLGIWLLLRVPVDNGDTTYQLPLVLARPNRANGKPVLGTLEHRSETFHLVDGGSHETMIGSLLSAMTRGAAVDTARGRLVPVMADVAPAAGGDERGIRALGCDSTNTLCRVPGGRVLKLYRCLDDAGTREAEMLQALRRHGCTSVPTLHGFIEHHSANGRRTALAMLQEWIDGAEDGWSWLTDRLADGPGVDVTAEIESMARVVAETHRGLAGMGSRGWSDDDEGGIRRRIVDQVGRLRSETDSRR